MNLQNNKLVLPKLEQKQREILIGKLLGDAHLEDLSGKKSYRLLIEHSVKQKEYVDHLYEIFKPIVSTPPREAIHKYTLTCGSERESKNIVFKTVTHPGLRFYGQLFYKDKVKCIPKNIHKLLTPRVLAYWYMDDGSRKGKDRSGKVLHTEGFSFDDIKILSDALTKHNIENTIQNQNRKYKKKTQEGEEIIEKNYKIIYLTAAGDKIFTELIKPYVLDCFKYKL
jgi:hypothetical protein